MTATLTDDDLALLRQPFVAAVTTINKDGSPHSTPVWIDTDGQAVLFNTDRRRVKSRNIERDAHVAVLVVDPNQPFRWLSVRGRAELVDEGASEHIDHLAKKYMGVDTYPMHEEGEQRVIVRITPEHRVGQYP
jgi:PPOX class probable F420-dependent enzyme